MTTSQKRVVKWKPPTVVSIKNRLNPYFTRVSKQTVSTCVDAAIRILSRRISTLAEALSHLQNQMVYFFIKD